MASARVVRAARKRRADRDGKIGAIAADTGRTRGQLTTTIAWLGRVGRGDISSVSRTRARVYYGVLTAPGEWTLRLRAALVIRSGRINRFANEMVRRRIGRTTRRRRPGTGQENERVAGPIISSGSRLFASRAISRDDDRASDV